jgi:hypothetical protein
VEPEEAETARQQPSKHAPAAVDMHATTEELQQVLFSMRFMPRLYNEYQRQVSQQMVLSS